MESVNLGLTTILLSDFLNLSGSRDPTSPSICTHKNTEKNCTTVHSNSTISTKFRKGFVPTRTSQPQRLDTKEITIASLNMKSLLMMSVLQ